MEQPNGNRSRRGSSSLSMERRGSRPSRLELLAEQPERPPNPLIRVQPAFSPPPLPPLPLAFAPNSPPMNGRRIAPNLRFAAARPASGVLHELMPRRLSEPNARVSFQIRNGSRNNSDEDEEEQVVPEASRRRVRFSLDGAEDERRLRDFGKRFAQQSADEMYGEAYEDELSDCCSDLENKPRDRAHRIVQCGKDPLFSLSFHLYADSSESEEQPVEQMRLGFLGTPVTYGPFYEDASSDASACDPHDPPSPMAVNSASSQTSQNRSDDNDLELQSALYGETVAKHHQTKDRLPAITQLVSSQCSQRRKRSLPGSSRNRSTQTHPIIPVYFNCRKALSLLPLPQPKMPNRHNKSSSSTATASASSNLNSTMNCLQSPSITDSTSLSSSSTSSSASASTTTTTLAASTRSSSATSHSLLLAAVSSANEMPSTTHINQLCDDILMRILSRLSIRDQLNMEKVCQRWSFICQRLRRGRLAIKSIGDPRDNVQAHKCDCASHRIRDNEILEFGRFEWLLMDLLPPFHYVHTLNVSLFGLDRNQRRQLVHHIQTHFAQLVHLQLQSPTDAGLYRLLLSRPFSCSQRLRHFILHGCCDFERFALLTNNEDELRSSVQSPEIPHMHYKLMQMLPALTSLQLHCSVLQLPTQFEVIRQQVVCERLETLVLKQARLADQPLQSLSVLCPAIRQLAIQSAGPVELRLLAEKWASTLTDLRVQHVAPDQLIPLLQTLISFSRLKRVRINSSLLPSDRCAFESCVSQLLAGDRIKLRLNSRKIMASQLEKSRKSLQSILVMQELNALYQLKYLDLRRIEYKLQLVSGRCLSLLLARVCALNFCADVPLFEDHYPELLCEQAQADLEHPIDWPTRYAASNLQRYQRHEFQAMSLQIRHDHWRLRMQQRLLHRRMRKVRREYLQQLSDSESSSSEHMDAKSDFDNQLMEAASATANFRLNRRKWSFGDTSVFGKSGNWTLQSSISFESEEVSFSGSDSESDFLPPCDLSGPSSDSSRCASPVEDDDQELNNHTDQNNNYIENDDDDEEEGNEIDVDDDVSLKSDDLNVEIDFNSDQDEVDMGMENENNENVAQRCQSSSNQRKSTRRYSNSSQDKAKASNKRRHTRRLSQEQRQLRAKSRGPLGNLHSNSTEFVQDARMRSPNENHAKNNVYESFANVDCSNEKETADQVDDKLNKIKIYRRILPTSRTRLRSLTFNYNQNNAEEILFELISCSPDLRLIRIHDCQLPIQLLPLIATSCPYLIRLELNPLGYVYSCKYGLGKLSGMARLTELSLANMRIHDRKLAEVVATCPNLSRVYLSACKGVSGHTLQAFVQKARVAPDVRFELHVDSLADNEYRHFALLPNFAVYIDQYSFFKLNFEPFGRLFIFAPLPDRSTLSVHQWPSNCITLGQFRKLQPAHAQLRYFVKKREHQCSRWFELTDDCQPIPVIHNKIVINFSERDVLIK